MNLPVRAEGFVPSHNTVMNAFLFIRRFLLPETYEYIAVLESGLSCFPIGSPKPTKSTAGVCTAVVTYNKIVPLILVKVCEFV